jgi:hypothetical protein
MPLKAGKARCCAATARETTSHEDPGPTPLLTMPAGEATWRGGTTLRREPEARCRLGRNSWNLACIAAGARACCGTVRLRCRARTASAARSGWGMKQYSPPRLTTNPGRWGGASRLPHGRRDRRQPRAPRYVRSPGGGRVPAAARSADSARSGCTGSARSGSPPSAAPALRAGRALRATGAVPHQGRPIALGLAVIAHRG